jgi:hypothetical protein
VYSRKACIRPAAKSVREPTVRFAIVGNPRTGSSHLVSLLDSHPDVACWDDEIFDIGEAFDKSGLAEPRDFLVHKVFNVDALAVGFKLLWDAMERTPNVWLLLKTLGVKLVHTRRKNLLDSFISYRLATINKAFTCWYGEYKVTTFGADPQDCLDWFEMAERCDEVIRCQAQTASIPRLEVEYKELCDGQDRILEFLDASPLRLTSRLKKQRKGTQSDAITNYKELKLYFENSKWITHFEE